MRSNLFIYFIVVALLSCGIPTQEPIILHKDKCNECKMTISDPRFACEIVTKKGRVYKFDDLACMKDYLSKTDDNTIAQILIADFANNHSLHLATHSFFVTFESINSPMQGNTIAFANKDSAINYATLHNTYVIRWKDVIK